MPNLCKILLVAFVISLHISILLASQLCKNTSQSYNKSSVCSILKSMIQLCLSYSNNEPHGASCLCDYCTKCYLFTMSIESRSLWMAFWIHLLGLRGGWVAKLWGGAHIQFVVRLTGITVRILWAPTYFCVI